MLESLTLGGMVPFSTVDYPGALAAVVFCQGCPWSCPYCHNTHLQTGPAEGPTWSSVLTWLKIRQGLLDAVVFSGGEPTVQPGLREALHQVRAMGYLTGLHTAGCDPKTFGTVLPLLDWVGLDIKAPRTDYDRITGQPGSDAPAWETLNLLLASGLPHQIRTTVHPEWLPPASLDKLDQELLKVGASPTFRQPFRPPV
ncbi:anaerobic ribonucleoside-triphosphate reductase activating protein [Holophaga foetida]|uniref:anaerobic ribonucleoside-triphosphate reductase activating protein n=1 Tax=Holophaga foetida TaxID=35839 RepID=UPI00024750B3|nr:anaerobic ribonucleoside-triphosphate reductase activating protein [Holophaga foetida]